MGFLDKLKIPLFGIKIVWGGENPKPRVEEVKIGPIPIKKKEKTKLEGKDEKSDSKVKKEKK